jgi:hypothetical protein
MKYKSIKVEWEYEDQLPDMTGEEYLESFAKSEVRDGVRMFPYVEIDNIRFYLK